MEKNKILLLGLGQCGCNLVNDMINKNKRYAGVFINSSLGDLANINNKDEANTFIFNGTDGAGRDRKLAQSFVEKDIMRLSTFLRKYSHFQVVTVMSSLDGGTGSGSLPYVIKTLRQIFRNQAINLVGVLPRLDEDNLKLQNTLDCLAEIERVMSLVNSIRFINNDTRESYKEINNEAIEELDLSYGITGKHTEDSIDLQDSYNVNTCDGYSFTLNLPDRYKSISEALQIARENSVFAIPDTFDCTYGAINVKEGIYNRLDLKKSVSADKTVYTTYNDNKMNLIVLGGCDLPSEAIEMIKMELDDRSSNRRKRNVKRGFGLSINTSKSEQPLKTMEVVEDDDMDDMFNADFFRF